MKIVALLCHTRTDLCIRYNLLDICIRYNLLDILSSKPLWSSMERSNLLCVLYRQRTIHSTGIIQSDNSSHSHVHVQTGKAKNNQVTLKKLQKLTYTQKFVQDKAQFNGTNPFTWTDKRRILIANLYKWLLYFPDKFNWFVRYNFTKLIWLQGPSLLSYDFLLINKVQNYR